MNIQKITNYLVIGLGVLGFVFLALILFKGDDAIEMDALQGDFGSISYIILLAQIILAIAVSLSLGFSIKNLVSDSNKLKSSLMSFGAFAIVLKPVRHLQFLHGPARSDSWVHWRQPAAHLGQT